MGRPSPLDDERWPPEAAGAVFGDDDWQCIAASISPDGSRLMALYEFVPTTNRVRVSLLRDKFSTVSARFAEIHRQLAIAARGGGKPPQAS
jgi:hypothetical protein